MSGEPANKRPRTEDQSGGNDSGDDGVELTVHLDDGDVTAKSFAASEVIRRFFTKIPKQTIDILLETDFFSKSPVELLCEKEIFAMFGTEIMFGKLENI